MDAERMYQLCEPIQALSAEDRKIVADRLKADAEMVGDQFNCHRMTGQPPERRAVYENLALLVEALAPAEEMRP